VRCESNAKDGHGPVFFPAKQKCTVTVWNRQPSLRWLNSAAADGILTQNLVAGGITL